MGASELDFSVTGSEGFGRAVAALREMDAAMPEDIRRVIMRGAEAMAANARRKVLEEPTHGPKHTGLRGRVASGVSVTPTADGATIHTSMSQADEAAIPRGLDDRRGWRHPVFGRRNKWVVQHGAFSWFLDAMQDGKQDIEDELQRVLERAAERIAAAS